MRIMYLLVGKSGSGKSTIAHYLEQDGYKELKSYTTREPRYEDEDTHIFVTDDDFLRYQDTNEIVAYSLFNGNHYFCTRTQLYYNDVYVIDPDGIEYLTQHVDDVVFVVIYIDTPLHRRIWRMWKRGDSISAIIQRIRNDKVKFTHITYDYKIKNINFIHTLAFVKTIVTTYDYVNAHIDELWKIFRGANANG